MYWRETLEQWDTSPIYAHKYSSPSYIRTGSDDPFYVSKIRSGVDATNSLFTKSQSVYYKRGSTTIQCVAKSLPKRYGKRITAYGTSGWNPAPHSEEPGSLFQSSVSNAALIGIIKKIRKHETSDFAGPTFVGELRETLAMIRSPLKALRLKTGLFTDLHMRILRDKIARGTRFKAEPWYRVLSDTYLEWTFGAAPLISDISGICDLFLDQYGRAFGTRGLKRLSYRFSDDYFSQISNPFSISWPGTGLSVKFVEASHARSSAQYVVWIDQGLVAFPTDQVEWLSNAAKFDLSEIIPTAWELMPWSFLIDYWTNIGDVMGCTFNFNRNVSFAKLTTFNTVTKFHPYQKAVSGIPSEEVVVDFTPHDYTSQYTVVRRNSVPRLGFPQLDVSLPSLGQSFNMAALVTSLSKSNPFRGHTLK